MAAAGMAITFGAILLRSSPADDRCRRRNLDDTEVRQPNAETSSGVADYASNATAGWLSSCAQLPHGPGELHRDRVADCAVGARNLRPVGQ